MQNWGLLILMIGIAAANLPSVMQQWRTDRQGFIKTLWLMAAYALYFAMGIALFVLLAPRQAGETRALLLTGVMVGYILYGGLTLMRLVPRYREPPAWLMRFGIADILLFAMIFGCLTAYLAP
jgi:hypothetical protein